MSRFERFIQTPPHPDDATSQGKAVVSAQSLTDCLPCRDDVDHVVQAGGDFVEVSFGQGALCRVKQDVKSGSDPMMVLGPFFLSVIIPLVKKT